MRNVVKGLRASIGKRRDRAVHACGRPRRVVPVIERKPHDVSEYGLIDHQQRARRAMRSRDLRRHEGVGPIR